MARRLGAWDCSYCNTKRIMGNVFDCPGCGHPRPRGVRFYPISDGPLVTTEIATQLGSGGPNWYCEHCDSGNKDNSTKCWKCGAAKGSSPSHEVKYYKQGEAPKSTEEADKADPDGKSWAEAATEKPQRPSEPGNDARPALSEYVEQARAFVSNAVDTSILKPIATGTIAVAGLVLLGVLTYQFFFNTRQEMVRVSGFNWTQNVTVQEYQVVHESSWTIHPAEAYNVTSDYRDTGRDEKVHDGWETVEYQDTCYETVSYQDTCTRSVYESKSCTGTRDNGDGSFDTYNYECGSSTTETYACTNTRQEPYSCTKTRQEEQYHYKNVYDWYYEYDINKWITVANYPTVGNDHKPYYFSEFGLNDPYNGNGAPRLGQQQQFQIPGKYTVTFFCSNNAKVGESGYLTKEYPLQDWELFGYEIDYPIEVNVFNNILTYPTP